MSGPVLLLFVCLMVLALAVCVGLGVVDVVIRSRRGHREKWGG